MNAPRNEITVYEHIGDPVTAVKSLGESIAKSQLFGCQNAAQGEVLALECMAQRLPPLALARRFDLMNGKLSMKSQTMLADFRTNGGKTRLVEKSGDRAAIWMQDRDGEEYNFDLTWSDAKGETFPYLGKESEIVAALQSGDVSKLKLKPKYATPRSRAIMLWNRLISDSVRAIAPEINCGQYTPEEIEDFTGPAIEPAAIESQPSKEECIAEDAEFEVFKNAGKESNEPSDSKPSNVEAQQTAEEPQTSVELTDPVSEATIETIKGKIKEAAQLGVTDIVKNIKTKLAESGLNELADLTISEAERLISAIEQKSLGAWFENPVVGHATTETTASEK